MTDLEPAMNLDRAGTRSVVGVLFRGLLAAPLAGAACGLAVGVVLVVIALSNGSPAGAYVVLGLAGWIGAIVGVVVGVPAAILLALVSLALPEARYGAGVGLGVAGATGFVAAIVVGGAMWQGAVFGGVCAIVGAATGRVVLFGRAARVRQDQPV